MHKSLVVPFSPLLMHFIDMKQNDFNLVLLSFLAEEFHEKFKSETSLFEYSKIFTNFSQASNLCTACVFFENTDALEHYKKTSFEEAYLKVIKLKIYDETILKKKFIKPSRYGSEQIENF